LASWELAWKNRNAELSRRGVFAIEGLDPKEMSGRSRLSSLGVPALWNAGFAKYALAPPPVPASSFHALSGTLPASWLAESRPD
jgi:hypothetical protein